MAAPKLKNPRSIEDWVFIFVTLTGTSILSFNCSPTIGIIQPFNHLVSVALFVDSLLDIVLLSGAATLNPVMVICRRPFYKWTVAKTEKLSSLTCPFLVSLALSINL